MESQRAGAAQSCAGGCIPPPPPNALTSCWPARPQPSHSPAYAPPSSSPPPSNPPFPYPPTLDRLPESIPAPHQRSGLTPAQYSHWLDSHTQDDVARGVRGALQAAGGAARELQPPASELHAFMLTLTAPS